MALVEGQQAKIVEKRSTLISLGLESVFFDRISQIGTEPVYVTSFF